jgi:hypothetical protein
MKKDLLAPYIYGGGILVDEKEIKNLTECIGKKIIVTVSFWEDDGDFSLELSHCLPEEFILKEVILRKLPKKDYRYLYALVCFKDEKMVRLREKLRRKIIFSGIPIIDDFQYIGNQKNLGGKFYNFYIPAIFQKESEVGLNIAFISQVQKENFSLIFESMVYPFVEIERIFDEGIIFCSLEEMEQILSSMEPFVERVA